MTEPFTLVVNPAAGGGKPGLYLPRVIAVLDAAKASYQLCESTSLQHAKELAATATRRGDTVVSFGGDGLTGALVDVVASQAASQVASEKTSGTAEHATRRRGAFGIIPAGRGNDFARTLRIPFEPGAAAGVLLAGRRRQLDLIEVTGTGAQQEQSQPTIVAGSVYTGIASVANEIANRSRLIRGPAVYNLAALRALLRWKATSFSLESTAADGTKAASTIRGYAVVVANCPFFGAGMKVAPDAEPTDGMLDIVIMRHAPKLTFVRVLLKIKDGSHVTMPEVSTLRVKAAELSADRPLPVGADGELLPVRLPLRLRALPGALDVIVPG
jgi:diacylglycerol kinase (ATP)